MDFKPQGVLFDFDGTLARTMEDNFAAWKMACADLDLALAPDDYYPLEGMNLFEIAAQYLSTAGRGPNEKQNLVKKKEAYYLEISREKRLEFYPGVYAILETLRVRNLPIAIVTSALSERVAKTVPPEFLSLFQAVVTGDEVRRGKPFPDPYLAGARKLNLEPCVCLAVENAPLGIKSAHAAGMRCVAVASTLAPEKLTEADAVIGNFKDLETLLFN